MRSLSFLFMLTLTALQTVAPPSDNGSIEGVIVVAGGSEPLSETQVVLRPAGTVARISEQTTKSGTDGRFVFSDVAPGKYAVEVQREGYFAPSPNSNSKTISHPVTIQPKEKRNDLAITMVPGGAVSGYVRDRNGKPVVRANITVAQLSYSISGQPRLLMLSVRETSVVVLRQSMLTDDRGYYRVSGLPIGIYYVRVEGSPLGSKTYHPNVMEAAQSSRIVIGPGSDVPGIDITMQAVSPFRISGTVTVQPGPPRPVFPPNIPSIEEQIRLNEQADRYLDAYTSYRPYLVPHDQNALSDAYMRASTGTLIRAGGTFEILGVAPGHYTLIIQNSGGRMTQLPINIADGNMTDINVVIPSAMTLTGRMRVQGNAEIVNLSSLAFSLESMWQTNPAENSKGIITKEGLLTFTDINPGKYRVAIRSLPANAYIAEFRQGPLSIMQGGIVTVDGNNAPLEVTVSTSGGGIRGVVLDPKDKKGVSALVTVMAQPQPLLINMQPASRILTNPDGSFTVPNLAPGEYKLFAWENIPLHAELNDTFMSEFNNRGMNVRVSASGTTNVELSRIPQATTIR